MVEPSKNPALGKELILQDINVPVFERERLQRVVDAKLHMHNLVHRPHRTFAKESDDAVHANRVIWVELSHLSFTHLWRDVTAHGARGGSG